MLRRSTRAIVLAAVLASTGSAQVGCELAVQLDRSAFDAGPEAGCPICSDASFDAAEDGGADSSLDAGSDRGTDVGPD